MNITAATHIDPQQVDRLIGKIMRAATTSADLVLLLASGLEDAADDARAANNPGGAQWLQGRASSLRNLASCYVLQPRQMGKSIGVPGGTARQIVPGFVG